MRLVFLLTVLLATNLISAAAQDRASVVEVSTDLSVVEATRAVAQTFIREGFSVLLIDSEVGIVSSGGKDFGRSAIVQVNALVTQDGLVEFRGLWGSEVFGLSGEVVDERGSGGSPARRAWDGLLSVADRFVADHGGVKSVR